MVSLEEVIMTFRSIWFCILAICVTCFPAVAEEGIQKNIVSIDPVSMYFGVVAIEYERVLDSSHGVGISVSHNVFGRGKFQDTEWDELVIGLGYKTYHGKHPMRGWHSTVAVQYVQGDYFSTAPSLSRDYGGVPQENHVLNRLEVAVFAEIVYRLRLSKTILISPGFGYRTPFVIDPGQVSGSVEVHPWGGLYVGVHVGIWFQL